MKYKNAAKILPPEMIEQLQQYVQGEYLYIPIKDKEVHTNMTDYALEVQKRDGHIYTNHLQGISNAEQAQRYALSESSIRRIISKERKRFEKMNENILEILKEWDMGKPEIKQIYDSAWQVGEEYVLKVYDNQENLERNIRLISILSDLGIPVGSLINTGQDRSYTKDNENYYILTQRLKGNPIVSSNQLEKLSFPMGRIIAELHRAFLECEKQEDFWENSLLQEMKGWIKDTLEEDRWTHVSKSLFEDTLANLEKWYDTLPVQLIHRDVHFGNFLFEGECFSGYIDFDLSQKNIRIFDLCYFLLGLMCEEEALSVTEEKWFQVLKDVFRGYTEINPLQPQEIQAVPYVMKSIEFLFAAWFLGQKDMKCCEDAVNILKFVDENTGKILDVLKRL